MMPMIGNIIGVLIKRRALDGIWPRMSRISYTAVLLRPMSYSLPRLHLIPSHFIHP